MQPEQDGTPAWQGTAPAPMVGGVASYVAISGPGDGASEADQRDAFDVAEGLAEQGVTILCGGLGGVMQAAARGARAAGGTCIGLLPGNDRADADPALTYSIPTGLGELRNGLLVRAADAVVVVGGSWGTLSELALAMRTDVPVVALRPWPAGQEATAPPLTVDTADEAVDEVWQLLQQRP